MNAKIEHLLGVRANARKEERRKWQEGNYVCNAYQWLHNAPDGMTLSGYLQTRDYETWRKQWKSREDEYRAADRELRSTISEIHPMLTLPMGLL